MTAVLHDHDLDLLPAMRVALDVLEPAFAARVEGRLISPPRHHVRFGDHGQLVFTIGGQLGEDARAGFRVYDTFRHSADTQLTAVWSPDQGQLLGVILGPRLGQLRTGAIGAIAVRHMSAPDASRVAVLGCGPQARTQLIGAACVRALEQVCVFSRDPERRKRFAAEMSELLQLPVEAAGSARSAVLEADIVLCATSSTTPVMEASWLKPGAHVGTIGPKSVHGHELDLDVAALADVIATDSHEQAHAYSDAHFLKAIDGLDNLVDLAELVSGQYRVREHGPQNTLFCSTGLAGTDVLLAAALLERCGR